MKGLKNITIDRAVLWRALEALRPQTAPSGAKRDAAFEELRAALAAQPQTLDEDTMSQEINNELELIRSILRGYKPSMARDDALYATARVKRLVGQDRAQRGEPSQPGREHTESEVQEILRDDWNMSQDSLENTVRRILGVPKP